MAKPKKKRDLRARLGRTITPKTGGGGGAAAPVPAPNLGGAPAPEPSGAEAAPAGVTPPPAAVKPPPKGIARPPAALGGGGRADLAPPPFAQAAAEPEAPTDPFAASEQAAHQPVVRLEFDDKLVADHEVGKTKRAMVFIVAGVGIAVGLVIGGFGGSTFETNKIFDRTVQDGVAINTAVTGAEDTLNDMQRMLRRAQDAAAPSDGSTPAVDYETMEALRGVQQPFELNDFTQRNYSAFAGLADSLIRYVNQVTELFERIQALTASVLRQDRREELDRTAEAAGGGAAAQLYGAVLVRAPTGEIQGALVYLERTDELTPEPEEGAENAPPAGLAQARLRANRGGAATMMRYYTAAEGETIGETPQFVVTVDGARSAGVLRDQTSAFDRYKQELDEVEALLGEIISLQGQVITTLHRGLTDVGADLSEAGGGA